MKILKLLAVVALIVVVAAFIWTYRVKKVIQRERVGDISLVVYTEGGIARDNQSLYVSISDDAGLVTVARLAEMEDYARFGSDRIFDSAHREGLNIVLNYVEPQGPNKLKTIKLPWTWLPENPKPPTVAR